MVQVEGGGNGPRSPRAAITRWWACRLLLVVDKKTAAVRHAAGESAGQAKRRFQSTTSTPCDESRCPASRHATGLSIRRLPTPPRPGPRIQHRCRSLTAGDRTSSLPDRHLGSSGRRTPVRRLCHIRYDFPRSDLVDVSQHGTVLICKKREQAPRDHHRESQARQFPTPDSSRAGQQPRVLFGSSLFEPMKPLPCRHFKLGPALAEHDLT